MNRSKLRLCMHAESVHCSMTLWLCRNLEHMPCLNDNLPLNKFAWHRILHHLKVSIQKSNMPLPVKYSMMTHNIVIGLQYRSACFQERIWYGSIDLVKSLCSDSSSISYNTNNSFALLLTYYDVWLLHTRHTNTHLQTTLVLGSIEGIPEGW